MLSNFYLFGFGSVEEITKDINKPNIKIITGKNLEAKITLSIALIALYLLK